MPRLKWFTKPPFQSLTVLFRTNSKPLTPPDARSREIRRLRQNDPSIARTATITTPSPFRETHLLMHRMRALPPIRCQIASGFVAECLFNLPIGGFKGESMARRCKSSAAEDLMDLVALMPWWTGVALALASYWALHAVATRRRDLRAFYARGCGIRQRPQHPIDRWPRPHESAARSAKQGWGPSIGFQFECSASHGITRQAYRGDRDDQSYGADSVCGTTLSSMRKTDAAARGEARRRSGQSFLGMLSVF